ncbi:MAG: ATP-binding protein [Planctomycetales bacterium]
MSDSSQLNSQSHPHRGALLQESSRWNEEKYRILFDSIDEGFCVVEMIYDAEGKPADYRFLEVNPAFEKHSQLPNAVGRTVREILPTVEPKWFEFYDKVARTGESVRFENFSPRLNRWFDVYAFRAGKEGERKVGLLFNDITKRKESEERLRRVAALDAFRVELDNVLRPLADPNVIQAEASRLLGEQLRASRVLYGEIHDSLFVIHQDYADGVAHMSGEYRIETFGPKMVAAVRAGETVSSQNVETDERLTDQDRKAYVAGNVNAFVGVPLVKNGVLVAALVVHSKTARIWTEVEIALIEKTAERTWGAVERARAEEDLRQNQEERARQQRLYEAILTNTPDLAYIFDLNHRFIYANEILLRMWGKTREEAIGRNCLELGYEPWHAEMHDREIDQVIATKQPIRGEVPFSGTFGRRIYDYIFVPVFGLNGEVEAVAGTTRDVTDRKEADHRKDEFLATLAHELRNPLAPIRSSINILQMSGSDPETVGRICEMIERQVTHMVRLVDDLMEVSRITRGIIELQHEQTDLATIVRSAVDTSQPIIAESAHRLSVSLPQGPVPIYGDGVRLAQVISNLLNNAAKYTDRGGQIGLSAEREDNELVIRVRDNGIGIPAEKLPFVFDMFMQVDRSNRRAQGGLGIGLTLVKRLVEMHEGSITVESDGPGQGSEFIVRLPLTIIDPEEREPDAENPPVVSNGKRRVLVVDDNRDAATTLGMLMKALGSEVQTANDGPTALSIMESFRPDLVLLDIGMPQMDGYEVARRIRQRPEFEKIQLAALTGWGQDSDRERTREAGFNHHLVKPAGIQELQGLLGQ